MAPLMNPGNAGLGKETIIHLARQRPKRIYMAARSQQKAAAAIADIKAIVPGAPVSHIPMDLASFKSISEGAKKFQSQSSRLDVLFNNAGVMALPNGKTTDGYEVHFGTNVMGPFLLTKLLLPTLQKTAKEPGADVRIVSIASEAHRMQMGALAMDEKNLMAKGPWPAYANSKLGNILLARECARRHPEITSVSVHPGIIAGTTLWDNFRNSSFLGSIISKASNMIFSSIEDGAKNQLWASTCRKEELKNGAYYVPIGKLSSGSGSASSTAKDAELWDYLDGECKKHGY